MFRSSDVPAPEQPELFLKKLQQCCTVFDFMDTLSDLKMKEYKRSTLNELVDYVTVSRGYLTEQAYPDVVKMVSARTHLSLRSSSLCYTCPGGKGVMAFKSPLKGSMFDPQGLILDRE